MLYLVRAGDTLTAIADHYRLPITELTRANHLDPAAVLPVGVKLRVPLASLRRGADSDDSRGRARVRALIANWAAYYGVDPRLARALAWMESGYNQSVVSSAGAEGVMQVTPAAWAYVESVLVGRRIAHDLAGNVQVGIALLHELLRQFASNRSLALAAYLQGSHSVRTEGSSQRLASTSRTSKLSRRDSDRAPFSALGGRVSNRLRQRGRLRAPERADGDRRAEHGDSGRRDRERQAGGR